MSESTQSTTERNPFTKPGFIISAALIVALLAAVVVIFLVPKAGNGTPSAAAGSSGNASATIGPSAAPVDSICGLPATSETSLGAAPKSTWTLVDRMAAPTDPVTFGPGLTEEDGFRSCFAHSATGALYAAANIVALGSSPAQDKIKLAERLIAPGPGRDAAMADAKARASSSSGSEGAAQIRGFLLKAYSATEADVDLAIQLPTGAHAHTVLSLRWLDGDWKVKAADDGQIFNSVDQVSGLGDFIPWAGV